MIPFSLLIKPSGSDCNIDCKYCFYKCRAPEVGRGKQRMSDEVLEKMIKDYLKLNFSNSQFAWQGGEPTLMGLDFFKKAVELQKKYSQPRQIVTNSMQTNGILLDKKWCKFLSENNFLVGISIDGPKKYHDQYRLDLGGHGTYDRVLSSIENCRKYNVEFNLLVLVNNENVAYPDELFDFFVSMGIKYLQFIPCIEMEPEKSEIADFSVKPQEYGDFICRIFDRWYEYGPQNLSIRDFDSILNYYVTGVHTICTYTRQCAKYIVIEHNGDAFVCDFFVDPNWRIGNIFETPIEELADSKIKKNFNESKQKLCSKCLICRHLDICRGGCVKDRLNQPDGAIDKKTYLCAAYKKFFNHSLGRFMKIAASVKSGELKLN